MTARIRGLIKEAIDTTPVDALVTQEHARQLEDHIAGVLRDLIEFPYDIRFRPDGKPVLRHYGITDPAGVPIAMCGARPYTGGEGFDEEFNAEDMGTAPPCHACFVYLGNQIEMFANAMNAISETVDDARESTRGLFPQALLAAINRDLDEQGVPHV